MTTKNNQHPSEYYLRKLEREWHRSLPRVTNAYLLETFPSGRDVFDEMIQDRTQRYSTISKNMARMLLYMRAHCRKADQWFWREVIKHLKAPPLVQINRDTARLGRLKRLSDGKEPPQDRINDNQIAQARERPIDEIALPHLEKIRKSGKRITSLCPFHQERTPSFTLYLETNTYYCFGCHAHGDTIEFLRQLHGYEFTEAVENLT